MPFRGHRGNSQVSGTSLCSLAASLTFVRLQLSPAWNPHLLRSCLWYALLLQQPQPCGIQDAVLPPQGLTRSREDWAQMPCASPSPRISHHWGQGALQRSGSRSHTPIIPRRRHPTDQGTAHVRVPGRLGWHVPPPLGSTASLYERPALPGIRGGGARKTGMKQKPGLNRMRT